MRPLDATLYKEMIAAAIQARENAHCPYSHFAVGAAILTWEDKIYPGCNIENFGLSPTLHAEQVAVSAAFSDGSFRLAREAGLDQTQFIRAVAVYIPDCSMPLPCAGCRQFLSEFGLNMTIIGATTGSNGEARLVHTLAELYPLAFPIESVIKSVEEKGKP